VWSALTCDNGIAAELIEPAGAAASRYPAAAPPKSHTRLSCIRCWCACRTA